MRVSIDSDRCRGHGICTTFCPEMFTINDDGFAEAGKSDVPAEFEDKVSTAASACPEQAIEVN